MIWIGIDAHKRVHQALALSADGVLGQKTVANTAIGLDRTAAMGRRVA